MNASPLRDSHTLGLAVITLIVSLGGCKRPSAPVERSTCEDDQPRMYVDNKAHCLKRGAT